MKLLAPNLYQISDLLPNAINMFIIEAAGGDVLVDAGTRWARRKLLRLLAGRRLSLIALTHVHPDHQGAAAALCEQFACPLACHAADRPAMEGREPMQPRTRFIRFSSGCFSGPPHAVSRELRDGDDVAEFRVIESPGHTPGHLIFFRESDRVAIVGDVLNNMNVLTTIPGLHQPPNIFTWNPEENRRSIRKLVALRPELVCFGHGPPLRDPKKLARFADRLG